MSADPGVCDTRVALLKRLVEPPESVVHLSTNSTNFRKLKRVPGDVGLPQLFEKAIGIFHIPESEV